MSPSETAQPTAKPKRPRRLWLFLPWALFVAIVAGWTFYWFAVADAAERSIAQWKASVAREGGGVTYTRVVRHGFPVLMRLELSDVHYQAPRAHWSLATAEADLNIEMLDPSHIILEYKAPVTLTHADGSTNTISADTAVVSLHNRGVALVQDGVEASNLSVADSAKPGVLHVAHVTANIRPDPSAASNDQLAFSAQGVTLARPVRSFEGLGQTIASLDAGIVIEQALALTAPHDADPLQPWRQVGGKARFEYLSLNWGALEAHGTGEAALDDQHRLTGNLRLVIPHPGPALSALAQSPSISSDTKQAIDLVALGLALRGHHVTFKVDAGDGELRIEHTRVRSLDPLY